MRCRAIAVSVLGAGVHGRVAVVMPQVPGRAWLDDSANPHPTDEFRELATDTPSAPDLTACDKGDERLAGAAVPRSPVLPMLQPLASLRGYPRIVVAVFLGQATGAPKPLVLSQISGR